MSEKHVSGWDEDEEGWIVVVCQGCDWSVTTPDTEIAADCWGDHMYEVGFADARARSVQP